MKYERAEDIRVREIKLTEEDAKLAFDLIYYMIDMTMLDRYVPMAMSDGRTQKEHAIALLQKLVPTWNPKEAINKWKQEARKVSK